MAVHIETLHQVFPRGDVEEMRRLLANTSEESRLYVVTEILLKSRHGNSSDAPVPTSPPPLEPWEKFRSEEYKYAVKKLLFVLPTLLSPCPPTPPGYS